MKARDIMISPVVTISRSSTVREVAQAMMKWRISGVPVVDDANRIVGVVTEGDLLRRAEVGTEHKRSWWLEFLAGSTALAEDYVRAHAKTVKDIMTTDVVTASPDTPLSDIASLMEKRKVKRIPIVDTAGDPVGIVSRSNLVQALAMTKSKLEVPMNDLELRRRILEKLDKESWTRGAIINVSVSDGVVDLSGVAPGDAERKAVRVAVEQEHGVKAVNNNLALMPAMAWE